MEKDITLKEFKEAKAELRDKIKSEIVKAMNEFYDKTGGIWIYPSKVDFEYGYEPEVYLNIKI